LADASATLHVRTQRAYAMDRLLGVQIQEMRDQISAARLTVDTPTDMASIGFHSLVKAMSDRAAAEATYQAKQHALHTHTTQRAEEMGEIMELEADLALLVEEEREWGREMTRQATAEAERQGESAESANRLCCTA
ncbi:hypothetical protein KIPB_011321, partial [Kipferlia bialata]